MKELMGKVKSMNKKVLIVIGVFVAIAIANMLGYGG